MQTIGADFNVSMRGDNQLLANKLLVQVDGRSITVDAQVLVFWKLIPVTLPEIKRIEVLKGPAGAIHGFNAFDGVINIITKSPDEVKGSTVQVAGGELDTITSSAIYGGTHGNFSYRLSAGYDQANDWDDRDKTALQAYKFNVQTEYRLPAQAKLRLAGGVVDADDFNSPITEAGSSPGDPFQPYALLEYADPNVLLRTYWNRTDTKNKTLPPPALVSILQISAEDGKTTNDSLYDTYDVLGQHMLEFGNASRLTYGGNYRHNRTSTNFFSKTAHEDRLGLYVQGEWTGLETLTAAAGFRFDMDTFINPTYSPRGSLVYEPIPNHTLRAAVSVGYRPPTAFERNVAVMTRVNLPPPFGPIVTQTRGSKNLDPEKIVSYEFGYQGWFLNHRLRLRADLFYNHLKDLIQLTALSAGGPTSPINGGHGDIYGGEAGVEILFTPWLSGFVNYSYQDFDQNFKGQSRRTGAQSKVSAGMRIDMENGLNGEALFHYVGPTTYPISSVFESFAPITGEPAPNPRVGSYTLLNIRGAYRFWEERASDGHRRQAEVAISAFNALNDRHKEHPLGETIKSRVMGWLTLKY
jgi:iron complex outermembrane receptor protein